MRYTQRYDKDNQTNSWFHLSQEMTVKGALCGVQIRIFQAYLLRLRCISNYDNYNNTCIVCEMINPVCASSYFMHGRGMHVVNVI